MNQLGFVGMPAWMSPVGVARSIFALSEVFSR